MLQLLLLYINIPVEKDDHEGEIRVGHESTDIVGDVSRVADYRGRGNDQTHHQPDDGEVSDVGVGHRVERPSESDSHKRGRVAKDTAQTHDRQSTHQRYFCLGRQRILCVFFIRCRRRICCLHRLSSASSPAC